MTQDLAIKPHALQKAVDLVYVHSLPVHLILSSQKTASGLRILSIEYDKEDEKLIEWLYDKATSEDERQEAQPLEATTH